jgi:hypothetical protein
VEHYKFFRTLVLAAWGTLVFPGALGAQYLLGEPLSADFYTSAASPGYLSNRLLADTDGYRFLFLSLKDFEKPDKDYTAAGFDSPWLTVGPVNTGGLFREIFSPLGYTAGSSVFAETSRLTLKTAAERSTRRGIWVSTPGDYAAAGAYTDGDEITHTAAAFNFFKGKRGPLVSALLMGSQPDERLDSADWFPEKPLFPGGDLYHAAFRAQIPFDTFTGGLTRVGACGALSFGQRVVPAGYYTFFASHTDKTLDIRLLQGAAEKDYVNPAGRYPSYRVSRSASFKLFPRGPLIPYLSAAQNIYQVYKPTLEARPERLTLSGGTEYRTKRLSLKIYGSRKTEKDSHANRAAAERLTGAILYRTGRLSLSTEYASSWENAVMTSRRASLRAEYSPKGWEFSGRLKGEWKPDLMLSGKLSAAFKRPGLRLGIAAELAKALAPRPSGLEALRERPFDYMTLSVFFRYSIKL